MTHPYIKRPPYVLVTGGGGYVGSHTCKALHAAGYIPITLDNFSYGHRWAVKWGPLEEGDCGNKDHLHQLFAQYPPLAVFHFAGDTYVGESVTDPLKYYRNNVTNTLSLLEELLHIGKCPVIFSSSCATYGNPKHLPLAETHQQMPISPYGFTKLAIERMLADFHTAYRLPYVALRYFNAAGADLDGQIGEWHDPETHLIPLLFDVALDIRPHLTVFGTDYDTPDGTAIRDYVHVSDLAEAHVKALIYLLQGGESGAFNLGTGRGYSVKEIIETTVHITQKQIPLTYGPPREGDAPMLIADPTKSKRLLDWTPTRSDLFTIIHSAWQWHRQRELISCHES